MTETDQPKPEYPQQVQDVLERATGFSRDLLLLHPDVVAVAVVPVFAPTVGQRYPGRLPSGVAVGGDGAVRRPDEIVPLCQGLLQLLDAMLRAANRQLLLIDEAMASQARQLQAAVPPPGAQDEHDTE